jgi:ABC-type iron transport system FetAB ATPase subunit
MSRLRVCQLRVLGHGPYDLEVGSGECVTLAGESGAGKTLLLRAIADLEPHTGELWLDGVECAELDAPAWRRRVGLLPSESRWWRARVGEHFTSQQLPELERLGFGRDVLEWTTERLSSGERQRLALLRLLVQEPTALLLDEPTAHLDRESTTRVESLLADYHERTGASVLWVTHSERQGPRVATRHLRVTRSGLEPETAA